MIYENIDWEELHKQKMHLLELTEEKSISAKIKDSIEGVLGLIDAIQEDAVDNEYFDEEIVFPHLNKEE